MTDLEKNILEQVRQSIQEAIKARLTLGYADTTLNKLIDSVTQEHSAELRATVSTLFAESIRQDSFKTELRGAFNHKLARVLVGKFEGEIEKQANAMRTDPATRARITLAIEAAIKQP